MNHGIACIGDCNVIVNFDDCNVITNGIEFNATVLHHIIPYGCFCCFRYFAFVGLCFSFVSFSFVCFHDIMKNTTLIQLKVGAVQASGCRHSCSGTIMSVMTVYGGPLKMVHRYMFVHACVALCT